MLSRNRIALPEKMREYEVLIGKDFHHFWPELFSALGDFSRIAVLSNEVIFKLYPDIFTSLQRYSSELMLLNALPDGEEQKSMSRFESLLEELISYQLDRHAILLCIGGGVVGDLGGFVAASYLRGIRFVQMPTTLLAAVDASVGGKVAVNSPQGKNLIGAFYQPAAVWTDLNFFHTLEERDYLSGVAEVVKHALIGDYRLLNFLFNESQSVLRRDEQATRTMVERSIILKSRVVAEDEKESGLRAILNFGHTVAHAIEALQSYQGLRHGEAVAVGMITALILSQRKYAWPEKDLEEIISLFQKLNLPLWSKGLNIDAIVDKFRFDKKREKGIVKFVLLPEIGKASYGHIVDDYEIKSVLEIQAALHA